MKWFSKLLKRDLSLKKQDIWMVLVLVFMIGSFTGFIYEEIFYFFEDGILSKRGFLYGPYLPVYGWGALLLYLFLKPIKKHPILVFSLSMLITGILEYLTGKVMFLIWQERWWDYTGLFLNIEGFVCLRSVLTFAVGGLFLLYIVLPFIHYIIEKMPVNVIKTICASFIIIFIIDNFIKFFFLII